MTTEQEKIDAAGASADDISQALDRQLANLVTTLSNGLEIALEGSKFKFLLVVSTAATTTGDVRSATACNMGQLAAMCILGDVVANLDDVCGTKKGGGNDRAGAKTPSRENPASDTDKEANPGNPGPSSK